MTAVQGPADLERFRSWVTRRLGLRFDDTRMGSLAEVLERCGDGCAGGVPSYLERLERASPSREDVRAVARELTVGETYFFRNMAQFRAFAEVALPEHVAARSATRRLRILSAGCASGEEAYSIAMIVRERLAEGHWDISITGIDVNPSALEKARAGRYSSWALRETPSDMEQRWFRLVGREYVLDPSIRGAVRFEERNLVDEEPGLWLSEAYDVVFCRNVLMYLVPETARAVVARVARALAPSGHLFLGHAETLRGLSHDFHLRHTHDTFYYQRKDELARLADRTTRDPQAWLPETSARALELDWASTWIETVQRSTERIRELSEQRGPASETRATNTATATPADGLDGDRPAADLHARGPAARGADVRGVIELLERERFGDALALIADLPRNEARDPDVLLLRAVLLTHSGELDAAESVCSELCGVDELNAGAHYLLALCREGAGDRKAALEHDGVAAYLDPDFAMPRLHLGLLARREGDMPRAQRDLEQALALLTREEPSRILLFGGGFTREALMHLCRAELRAARGGP